MVALRIVRVPQDLTGISIALTILILAIELAGLRVYRVRSYAGLAVGKNNG